MVYTEAKKKATMKYYYNKKIKKVCDICNGKYNTFTKKLHDKTVKHKYALLKNEILSNDDKDFEQYRKILITYI